jgi:hypothetical protein
MRRGPAVSALRGSGMRNEAAAVTTHTARCLASYLAATGPHLVRDAHRPSAQKLFFGHVCLQRIGGASTQDLALAVEPPLFLRRAASPTSNFLMFHRAMTATQSRRADRPPAAHFTRRARRSRTDPLGS